MGTMPGQEFIPMRYTGKITVAPYPIKSTGKLCLCVGVNQGGQVILFEGKVGEDEERFERLAESLNRWYDEKPDPSREGFIYGYAR